MPEHAFSCRCGALQGTLTQTSPGEGCHLICYCRDCRAFARHMGVADQLHPGGGSPLYQVLPNRIAITRGADQIACARLSPKGLHRWYAACCDTPLANTVGTSRMPLAGMWAPLFRDPGALGPVVTHGFTKAALPGGPKKDRGIGRMFGRLLRRSVSAYLSGAARVSPFFDAADAPVARPEVLSAAARRAAFTGEPGKRA